jgi:ATP-binding cassette subfamily B protein
MIPFLKKLTFFSSDDKKNLKRSLGYIKKYKFSYVIIIILAFCSLLLNIIQPYFFGQLIDILVKQNKNTIWKYVCIIFLLYLMYSLVSLLETFITIHITNSVVADVKKDMLNQLIDLPMRIFDSIQTGELINRIENDVGTISDILVRRFIVVVLDIGRVIVIGILLVKLNFKLALILFFAFPLTLVVFGLFGKILRKLNLNLRQTNDKYFSFLNEVITGIKEIKALGIQNVMKDKLYYLTDKVINHYKKTSKLDSFAVFSNMVIGGCGLFLIILLGSYQIANHIFSLGSFIAFYTYASQFYNAMQNLTELNSTVQSSLVAINRIFEFLDNFSSQKSETGKIIAAKGEGFISFENVSFCYQDGKKILENISIQIPPRKIIAFVGCNGSGKTTIFNLLLRFYEPQSGKICFNGQDIREFEVESWRSKISILMQVPFIFKGTIYENLKYGRSDAELEEMIIACKKARIDNFIQNLPLKYNTVIEGEEIKLSPGQKQRLAIARALLKKADIYLFDEPTSALDGKTEDYIIDIIREISKKHTVILISHRLSTVQIADWVIVLDGGKVVAQGTNEELLKNNEIYRNLFENQCITN